MTCRHTAIMSTIPRMPPMPINPGGIELGTLMPGLGPGVQHCGCPNHSTMCSASPRCNTLHGPRVLTNTTMAIKILLLPSTLPMIEKNGLELRKPTYTWYVNFLPAVVRHYLTNFLEVRYVTKYVSNIAFKIPLLLHHARRFDT